LSLAQAQTLATCQITSQGTSITYEQLLAKCQQADVIFFGELHDDIQGHHAELELLKDLAKLPQPLAIGLEMLESEDQTVLDELMRDQATFKHLEGAAVLWPNWEQDYLPLVQFAKEKKIAVWATNVPRRYAALVAKRGLPALDSLSPQAKTWMAPLPFNVPYDQASYIAMRTIMGGHGTDNNAASDRFVAAQAIKDITMAYFINKGLPKGGRLLHINGSFHSDYNEGILTYLKKFNPNLRTLTLAFRAKDADHIDKPNLADVVIVKP
jgi:uncharacterized iron-regulated protein